MEAGRSNKKVAAIIQARMGSNRLPGKIIMPLPFGSELPLLSWPVKSLAQVPSIKQIILATSNDIVNLPLADFARDHNIEFIAGSENDVLSRFVKVINAYNPDVIVRITGDNPILDAYVIEEVIQFHNSHHSDYTYSTGMPLGMNVEVVNSDALLKINMKDLTPAEREHVTLYFKRSGDFKVLTYAVEGVDDLFNKRLTVDYPADYAAMNLISAISVKTGYEGLDLIRFLNDEYSWIWEINNKLEQKKS